MKDLITAETIEKIKNLPIDDKRHNINNGQFYIKRNTLKCFSFFDKDGLYYGYIFTNKNNVIVNSLHERNLLFKTLDVALEFLIKEI